MKLIFSLLLSLGLVIGSSVNAKVLPAKKIMTKAYAEAAKDNKKVMVIFHASWCGWCKRMDSLMNVPETKNLFDKNFVIRHLVVQEVPAKKQLENPGAAELMNKYNGEKQGIPFWLIFDAKGNFLSDSRMPSKDKAGKDILTNVGCPANPDEVSFFISLLKKTTTLKEPELKVIADKFIMKQVSH
jgi:thioredoxin-related protein